MVEYLSFSINTALLCVLSSVVLQSSSWVAKYFVFLVIVIVLWLFPMVRWVGLQSVIGVFPVVN